MTREECVPSGGKGIRSQNPTRGGGRFSSSVRRWPCGRGQKEDPARYLSAAGTVPSGSQVFPWESPWPGTTPGIPGARPSAGTPWAGTWPGRTCRRGRGSARFPPPVFSNLPRPVFWDRSWVLQDELLKAFRQPRRSFQGEAVAGAGNDDGLFPRRPAGQGSEFGITLPGYP